MNCSANCMFSPSQVREAAPYDSVPSEEHPETLSRCFKTVCIATFESSNQKPAVISGDDSVLLKLLRQSSFYFRR